MPTNPFEDILIKAAEEIAKLEQPAKEEQILFILRKWLNPFPSKPEDRFASLFNVKDLLNPKQS
jgi:hypothetical protein